MSDCPECEYCCILGICCPPEAQRASLITLFEKATGEQEAECAKYADAIMDARKRAQKHESV